MLGERERRQPQPGGPALGPLVEQRHGLVRERDPVRLEQLCASPRARSAGRPRAARSARPARRRRCSPSRGSSRVASTTTQLGGSSRQEVLEQAQRLGGAQLVQVVDDEHDRLVERVEVRQQPLDHGVAAERRRGADPLDEPFLADRSGQPRRPPTARTAARPPRRARPTPRRPGRQGLRPSIQERSRTVLPLPAGAHTSSTPAGATGGQRTEQGAAGNAPARGR